MESSGRRKPPAALAGSSEEVLERRVRVAVWLAAAATAVGFVVDFFGHRAALSSLSLVAAVQSIVLVAAWVAIGARRLIVYRSAIALCGVSALCITTGISGVLRGDPNETLLLLLMICVVAGSLLPWGVAAQTVAVMLATAVAGGVALALDRDLGVLVGASALMAVCASIYAAHQSERQRAEIRRAMRDVLWRSAALEAVANAVVISDRTGTIEWVNPAFSALTGYSLDEAVGRNPRILRSGVQGDAFYGAMWQTILAGRVWQGELRNRRKDGSLYDEEMTITPWRDPDGAISHFIAIKRDVSERARLEALRRAAKRAAEAANQAKSNFLAQMSHEIRTPMNAIIGMTDLVLDTHLDAEQREHLELVKISADALLDVINDILELSRVEAGKVEIETAPFALRAVVESTVRMLAVRAGEKHVGLEAVIDPDVPDAVVGDAGRLRQILINLIGNAIKFTERGGVRVEVARVPAADGGQGTAIELRFAVRDTGIGIAAEKQAVIFRAFEQGDHGTRRHFGGTGLGLTISRRLAELMGGRIWVESTPGAGSTFFFTARVEIAAERVDAAPFPGQRQMTAAAAEIGPLHVLLAEDNPVNRKLAERLLLKRGHRVTVAEDGRAAVEASERGGFDIVLMDIEMPEMDGLSATGAIRRREHDAAAAHPQAVAVHLPIVAMTAHAMRGDEERCLAAGMDGYVTKPIRAAALFDEIARVITAARAARSVPLAQAG